MVGRGHPFYLVEVRKIFSQFQSSTFGQNYNAPCSVVSLQ